MIMPVVPPDATAVLPAQAPTQPFEVPPRHAARHAQFAEAPTQVFQSPAYRSDAYAGQVYGGGPYSGDEPTMQLPVIAPAPPAGDSGAEPPADDQGGRSLARNSAVMAAGSIVSRFTGLLRTVVISAAIGAEVVGGDYTLSNTLPNIVYELLLGGVMSSVIVPLLMRARTKDADKGEAYAQRLLSLATIFLAGATLVAVAAAPLLTVMFRTSKNTPADSHLITVLSYLLLPEIFFYGVAALIAAILNTRGHFAAPMWTPILNNIVVIATAGLFMLLPTAKSLTPETITSLQVLVLGGGTTLGIVAQAAGLFPALRKVGFRWKWRWDWRQLQLRQLARTAAWMLGYVIVNQASTTIILTISNWALHHGGSGPIVYNNAYLIFMMANGIVAVSIMTALMPRMSAAAAQQRFKDLTEHLSLGIRLSSVILIPATAAYLVLGRQLAVTIFDWGKYDQGDAIATGWVIAAAGLGLVPYALTQMQLFAFYAMPDTKTPTLLNVPVAVFRVLLNVGFCLILPTAWVNASLMIGMTISYVVCAILGNWLLRKRIGDLGFGPVLRTLLRLALAAIVAAVPTALLALIIQHTLGFGKTGSVVGLLVGALVLVIVYLAVATALRVKEISQVWGMLRGRIRR